MFPPVDTPLLNLVACETLEERQRGATPKIWHISQEVLAAFTQLLWQTMVSSARTKIWARQNTGLFPAIAAAKQQQPVIKPRLEN